MAIGYPVAVGLSGSLLFVASLILFSHEEKPSANVSEVPPLVGLQEQFFKKTRALLRQLTKSSQTLAEGYAKFSRNGQSFSTPDFSFKPHVQLPREHLKWLTAQPESVLSSSTVRSEGVAFEYMGRNRKANKISLKFVHAILNRCLTKNLDRLHADILDEVRASIDAELGFGDEWHQLKLGEAMQSVTDKTSCRILFGETLSQDKGLISSISRFNQVFGFGFFAVGHIPWLIRPFVAMLMDLILNFYMAAAKRSLVPFLRARIQDVTQQKQEGSPGDESVDFATQSVKLAMESKAYSSGNDADFVAEQFVFLAFATLFTTPTVATHVFLNIMNTAPGLKAYQSLREEAAEAFQSEADWTTPGALQKLVRIDSTIRESLRHSPLGTRGILREVMPEDGLVLPDGKKVPRGTWIGMPVEALQMDDRFYENPEEYDPFRFAKTVGDPERIEASRVSDTFLAFSYGRSACPGRWFAVHVLKLMIAYITINYDIEPVEKLSKNIKFGDANYPSFATQIRVRRRKQATSL